jgi:hypothetical protein
VLATLVFGVRPIDVPTFVAGSFWSVSASPRAFSPRIAPLVSIRFKRCATSELHTSTEPAGVTAEPGRTIRLANSREGFLLIAE